MRPLGLGVSFFAIPDAVRLHNRKLMLWRELQQHRDQALQKSNKRWLVLGLRTKDHDSRMRFLQGMLRNSQNPGPESSCREAQAISTFSALFGAMVLTGLVSDERFSREILKTVAQLLNDPLRKGTPSLR
jgi:hypothetical protein